MIVPVTLVSTGKETVKVEAEPIIKRFPVTVVSLGKEILPAWSMARLPAPVIDVNAPLVVVVAVEV